MIPFERHFTEKEQNKHLKEQLQQEIDGILNWCIKGLYMYRKEGLEPPTVVQMTQRKIAFSASSHLSIKMLPENIIKSIC